MSNVEELKTVLKQTLENRGVLGQLKARIRSEVHSALEDRLQPKPQLPHENFLINELIKEYLEFNQYHYTSSVLVAETGHPKESISKEFISKELNFKCETETQNFPILYKIISSLVNRDKDHKATDNLQLVQDDLKLEHDPDLVIIVDSK